MKFCSSHFRQTLFSLSAWHLGGAFVGLAAGLGLALPNAGGDARAFTMPVSEIKEGMKGYGLTVFKGTEPERFDVEVVGVLHNFRPSQDLILVKTPHPRLNITKNVRGMSGSPIFLDGRLIGAYAYSWAQFQAEPVAGVTPIAPMLAELRRPIPPGFWPLEGAGPLPKEPTREKHAERSPTQFGGTPGNYDLFEHQKEMKAHLTQPSSQPLVPVSTPLMIGGLGPRTQAYVEQLFGPIGLEPMQAGGGSGNTEGAPLHFVNGGALGIGFVSGDVSFFGLGTVTYVEGTKAAGFGHPMMEAGVSAFPSAIGRVHWIFASDQHSSKIGEAARFVGALVQDRQSAVVADESKTAPVFPMHVEIKGTTGAYKTSWNMNVAEEKFMTPGFIASALSGAIEATANERRDVTWKLTSRLTIRNHGTLTFEDMGVAVGGMPEAGDLSRSRVVRTAGEVLNNPWEYTRIDKIDATLEVEYTKDVYQLRGVDVLDPVVDAGGVARLRLHLLPPMGAMVMKVVEVTLPMELAGKEAEVEILPGYEVAPDVPAPENLNQLLANAMRITPARTLVLSVKLPSQGVTYAKHTATRLPGFALDSLRTQNSDVSPEAFTSTMRTFLPIDKIVDRSDRVRIKVRAKP